jgi:Ca2+:H+ antiporter
LISLLSKVICDAIEGAALAWNLPRAFVGFVLLPIVGNAAEHATAIGMAYREKLDLAIAVALGSSTQIALFVIPLMVVVGWLLPGLDNDLTLDFPPFETTVTMLSVIIVAFQVQVGEVTYLSGFVLVVAYVIIALSFVYLHRKVEMIPVPGDPVRRALRGSAF